MVDLHARAHHASFDFRHSGAKNGLGHAFFNPTREVALGVLELIASVFLFVGAFFAYLRRISVALVFYCDSVICLLIEVVVEVGILIRQLRP